jgi:hypothetical protein
LNGGRRGHPDTLAGATGASQQDGSAGGQGTGPSSDRTLNAETPTLNLAHARHVSRHPLPRQARHVPILRANPYPEVTDPICRLPLPTLFYRLEAIHLGDLLRIWVRTGATPPRGPLPDFQGPRGRSGHRRNCGALRVPNHISLRDGRRRVDFIVDVDASTLFVDVDTSTIRHQCHQMSSMSTMSIKRRHCVNNIDNIGDCNNVRLCMT